MAHSGRFHFFCSNKSVCFNPVSLKVRRGLQDFVMSQSAKNLTAAVPKFHSTTAQSPPGRVKLEVQESGSFDSSKMKDIPMNYYINRNPRSAELLGIAEKPRGYITTKRRVDYYHRLMIEISSRHITAYVNHNNGKRIVEASTKEFCISRHLFNSHNVSAAFNVGRVLAFRCKEAGLSRVMWQYTRNRTNERMVAFMKGILSQGLVLNEPRPRKQLPPPGTLPKF